MINLKFNLFYLLINLNLLLNTLLLINSQEFIDSNTVLKRVSR